MNVIYARREGTHVQVTAVIEDFSGVGNMSLVTALDIFHAVNITTAALPATILSTQSEGFGQPVVMDEQSLSEFQSCCLRHWSSVKNLQISSILVGYLGSPITIDLLDDWLDQSNINKVVIDPVMGDQGKLYPGLSTSLPVKMQRLIRHASIITPNLTELQLLSGKVIDKNHGKVPKEYIPDCIQQLRQHGYDGDVIITGIPNGSQIVAQYCAANQNNSVTSEFSANRLPGHFYGTGDVFAACFTALLNIGLPRIHAFQKANQLVEIAIKQTARVPDTDRKFGLLIGNLLNQISNYNIRLRGK